MSKKVIAMQELLVLVLELYPLSQSMNHLNQNVNINSSFSSSTNSEERPVFKSHSVKVWKNSSRFAITYFCLFHLTVTLNVGLYMWVMKYDEFVPRSYNERIYKYMHKYTTCIIMLQSNPDITSSMVRNYVIVVCTDLFCYSQKSKKMLLLLSLKCFFLYIRYVNTSSFSC